MASLKQIKPEELSYLAYEAVEPVALEQARAITEGIRKHGESALLQYAVQLGDIQSSTQNYIIEKEDLEKYFNSLSENDQKLLQRTAKRIELFAQAQRNSIHETEVEIPGGKAGQQITPMQTAGCYAPGGRYPLPSSVLMTAITARVAGVKNVWVASPRPVPATLGAAFVAGADAVITIGGAQAIAAMAYGVGRIPPCDIIVGPGNKWVTAAKSLVSGKCAIDMLAGPSECLVIADETADPSIIAADLLAQAEHDVSAVPILVTTCEQLIQDVNQEIQQQLLTLPTRDTAEVSVQRGFAVLCPTMETCIEVSDRLAPEHLEIMTADCDHVAKKVNHYGGLFIGTRSAEVFGDYGAGPNHVLPTGGTAKYTGGLSVHTFLRIRTWLHLDDDEASQQLVLDSAQLARIEGLEGHARAAEKRLN